MNYKAAHFRKEVSVRLTLRASIIEKILRSAFPPPPDAFSPKPSLALSCIPAFALTSPWAGRQATLHEFAPQTAVGAHFLRAGRIAPPLHAEQIAAAPALAVSKIAGEKTKPEGCTVKKCNLFYLSGLLFFLAAALNFLPARITPRRWYGSALAPPFCVWVLHSRKNKAASLSSMPATPFTLCTCCCWFWC